MIFKLRLKSHKLVEIRIGSHIIKKSVDGMPSVGKKSSGPLPFLFDVLYFCIFKIHFPSQIQLCFYLSSRFGPDMPLRFSFATILPPESRNPVFLFKIDSPSQIQIRVYLS